jgi:hypothetical protein
MKRIQKGPVRGISLKLQEEERERRMDFVPEVSAIDTDLIEVDKDTRDMLEFLDMKDLPGIQVAQVLLLHKHMISLYCCISSVFFLKLLCFLAYRLIAGRLLRVVPWCY